jgi:hypothetical protein
MEGFVMYAAFAVTVLLCAGPLLHILLRRRLRTYFVYFVFGAGHLVLNVVASVSPSIQRTALTPTFQALLLTSSLIFFAVYVVILGLGAGMATRTADVLAAPGPGEDLVYRRYFLSVFLTAFAAAIFFYLVMAPPVILRYDLYGNWPGLIAERWRVVRDIPSYNWFALAFFEIPTFSVILCLTLLLLHGRTADREATRWWRRWFWAILPVSLFFSVGFLHTVLLVYLLAAVGMTVVFFHGRIPLGMVARYGGGTLSFIFVMYLIKKGVRFSGEYFSEVMGLIGHRIFEVNAWSAAMTVYLFPNEIPYLRGASFINFTGRPGFEQVDLAAVLYPYIYNDIVGGAPAPAVFESYANFGWAGALVTLLILSCLVVFVTLLSWSRSVFNFSMAMFLTLKTLLAWQGALWFGVLEPSFVVMVIGCFAWFAVLNALNPRRTVMSPAPVGQW